MNNKIIEIEDYTFLFTTLWSELPKEKFGDLKEQWPDFKGIMDNQNPFTPEEYNMLYQENLAFLESALQENEPNENTIVVSHHPPTYQVLPEKYAISPFREAFASDLVNLMMRTQPKYWFYGHCHHNMPGFNIEGTTLLTNQLGYVEKGEQQEFSGNKVLELG